MGIQTLFKTILRKLSKENYIVTIEEGNYVIYEKDTKKRELMLKPINNKERDRSLEDFYNQIKQSV